MKTERISFAVPGAERKRTSEKVPATATPAPSDLSLSLGLTGDDRREEGERQSEASAAGFLLLIEQCKGEAERQRGEDDQDEVRKCRRGAV